MKFSCLWEDENNQERRKMILKYHLTDDTIEIIEVGHIKPIFIITKYSNKLYIISVTFIE